MRQRTSIEASRPGSPTRAATGSCPLLGGDYSIAIGTVAWVSPDRDGGVLRFDTHGDPTVPATSQSGTVHGMALAGTLGKGAPRRLDRAGDDLAVLEVIAVNPISDRHNRTAEFACELVASAFGGRVP